MATRMIITKDQKQTFAEHLARDVARKVVPLAFDAAGLTDEAAKLRAIPDDASMEKVYTAAVAAVARAPVALAAALAAARAAARAPVALAAARAVAAARAAARAAAVADAALAAARADAADDAAARAAAVADAEARRIYAQALLDAADAAGIEIPIRLDLATQTLDTVVAEGRFSMKEYGWHQSHDKNNWCNTAHCQAGSAIAICADDGGWELEQAFGPAVSGGLIYAASDRAAGRVPNVPNFEADDDEGLADLHRRAAIEKTGGHA